MDQNIIFQPDWCTNCANHPLLSLFREIIGESTQQISDYVFVSGIGHSAKIPFYLNTNVFNTPSGQAISAAAGIKLANHNLKVIIITGDGDVMCNGLSPLLHSIRRNLDINLIMVNNLIQANSKGYPSPSTPVEQISECMECISYEPLSIVKLGLASGCTYIARGVIYDREMLKDLINRAISHKGFSIVEVIAPCEQHIKFEKLQELKEKLFVIDDDISEPLNILKAYEVLRDPDRVPIGLFHREIKKTHHARFKFLNEGSLYELKISRKQLRQYLADNRQG